MRSLSEATGVEIFIIDNGADVTVFLRDNDQRAREWRGRILGEASGKVAVQNGI